VAAWLRAISVAKARIARLIITMHREGNNAAISNASVLVPLAICLGMKVYGLHRLAYLTPVWLRRPVVGGKRGSKIPPEYLQVVSRIGSMKH
jgi:hypothetical protein